MIPKDIDMLVSFLNTKLRDDDMSLTHILEVNECNEAEIMSRLHQNNYFYDEEIRQIRKN